MFGLFRKRSVGELVQAAVTGDRRRDLDAALAALRRVNPFEAPGVMMQAIAVAKSVRADRVVALVDGCARGEQDTRRDAVKLLGLIDSKRITPVLLAFLGDRDAKVRYQAACGLYNLRDADACTPLKEAMYGESDGDVFNAELDAMVRALPMSKVDILRATMDDDSLQSWKRIEGANRLGYEADPGDEMILDALRAARDDPDPQVRAAATQALDRIEERARATASAAEARRQAERDAPAESDFFAGLVGRAVDIAHRGWSGLPEHVDPSTCSGSEFEPVLPGTYVVLRVDRVQGHPYVVIRQGGKTYRLDGGDVRARWPSL